MTGILNPGMALVALALAFTSLMVSGGAQAGSTEAAPWIGTQINGKECYNPRPPPGGGPYNYLNQPAINGVLNLVETAHFPEGVEQLKHGATGTVMADLDFVLRSFPNHHRALTSSIRYSLKNKKWKDEKFGVPAECYLQRAMKFAPRDSVPFELYGWYMTKRQKPDMALEGYKRALKLRPKDVMLNYNTALLMAKQGQYKQSMTIARALYDAGLDLPGLKNILIRAGKWEYTEEELAQLAIATGDGEEPAEQPDSSDEAAATEDSVDAEADAAPEAEETTASSY